MNCHFHPQPNRFSSSTNSTRVSAFYRICFASVFSIIYVSVSNRLLRAILWIVKGLYIGCCCLAPHYRVVAMVTVNRLFPVRQTRECLVHESANARIMNGMRTARRRVVRGAPSRCFCRCTCALGHAFSITRVL